MLTARGFFFKAGIALLVLPFVGYLLMVYLGFSRGQIVSSSMDPVLKQGHSYFYDDLQGHPMVGEIVVYRHNDTEVVHRVTRVTPTGKFITKGDANPLPDQDAVTAYEIIGTVNPKAWYNFYQGPLWPLLIPGLAALLLGETLTLAEHRRMSGISPSTNLS